MDQNRLIEVLKSVPETKLRLLDIVWEVIDQDGNLDMQKVLDREPDINLALAEAHRYTQQTDDVIKELAAVVRGEH